jgi:hypothetical protein
MRTDTTPNPLRVAARLRVVMADLDIESAAGLARFLGAQVSQVGNWMAGYNLPPVKWMNVLCRKRPGLTLDWLYLGIADGLPTQLAVKLIALFEGMDVPLDVPLAAQPSRARRGAEPARRSDQSRRHHHTEAT